MTLAPRERTAPADALSPQTPGPIQRAFDLLKLLAESEEPVAVREVAAALALPPSTSHRLLRQFVAAGFAVAEPVSRRYKPGPALHRIAALVHAKADLAKTVQPYLDELTRACDETSLFTVYDPATVSVSFIAKAEGSQALTYRIPLNSPVSAYWGSSSLVIVAHLPEAEIRRVIATAKASPVDKLPPLPERKFRAQLAEIRRQGVCVTKGLKLPGAVGTACPVFDSSGVVGGVTVTIPEFRFRARTGSKVQRLVRQSAREISDALGYRPT